MQRALTEQLHELGVTGAVDNPSTKRRATVHEHPHVLDTVDLAHNSLIRAKAGDIVLAKERGLELAVQLDLVDEVVIRVRDEVRAGLWCSDGPAVSDIARKYQRGDLRVSNAELHINDDCATRDHVRADKSVAVRNLHIPLSVTRPRDVFERLA